MPMPVPVRVNRQLKPPVAGCRPEPGTGTSGYAQFCKKIKNINIHWKFSWRFEVPGTGAGAGHSQPANKVPGAGAGLWCRMLVPVPVSVNRHLKVPGDDAG